MPRDIPPVRTRTRRRIRPVHTAQAAPGPDVKRSLYAGLAHGGGMRLGARMMDFLFQRAPGWVEAAIELVKTLVS